jgi:cyclopropane fatty-acyl-phospholipid synthase-like methyltransferase
MAVHYGYWDEETKTFEEALLNTNKKMAHLADIQSHHHVLDAGCGVGGSALYLASTIGCNIKGITLSQKQLDYACNRLKDNSHAPKINLSLQDFSYTNFPDETFDIIWGCESTCYANPKLDFIQEAKRLLKPGGKLIIADYFMTEKGKIDTQKLMKNWGDLWAIDLFHTKENFIDELERQGFAILENKDVSTQIYKSAKRMYNSYIVGALPSILYNLFHNTSRFGKHHYKSGYFQFKALQEDLWTYRLVLAQKI